MLFYKNENFKAIFLLEKFTKGKCESEWELPFPINKFLKEEEECAAPVIAIPPKYGNVQNTRRGLVIRRSFLWASFPLCTMLLSSSPQRMLKWACLLGKLRHNLGFRRDFTNGRH